ncbi:exonuclease domain-containing protein [Streptomyces sp. NPDC004528]|uniref:exonuclease domain-containing protein n=1 Tax=Streptomyces sp. NPDC004528 TaxID=3154550 RepID=UPI0033AFEC8E
MIVPRFYVGFDLETTGVDPETDRIVTGAVVHFQDGAIVKSRDWILDPGVEIPEAASNVHGITTAVARAKGQNPIRGVAQIAGEVAYALTNDIPLVIMNAPFDLTMLDRECLRYDITPVSEILDMFPGRQVVLDPLCLDRRADPYRKGKRTLTDLSAHYRIQLTNAHNATADAEAAVRITHKMLTNPPIPRGRTNYYDQVAGRPVQDLHAAQVEWFHAWAVGMERFLRRSKDPKARISPYWPMTPSTVEEIRHAA